MGPYCHTGYMKCQYLKVQIDRISLTYAKVVKCTGNKYHSRIMTLKVTLSHVLQRFDFDSLKAHVAKRQTKEQFLKINSRCFPLGHALCNSKTIPNVIPRHTCCFYV